MIVSFVVRITVYFLSHFSSFRLSFFSSVFWKKGLYPKRHLFHISPDQDFLITQVFPPSFWKGFVLSEEDLSSAEKGLSFLKRICPFPKRGLPFSEEGLSFSKEGLSFSKEGWSFLKRVYPFLKRICPFLKSVCPFLKCLHFSEECLPFSEVFALFWRGLIFFWRGFVLSEEGLCLLQIMWIWFGSCKVYSTFYQIVFTPLRLLKLFEQVGVIVGYLWQVQECYWK